MSISTLFETIEGHALANTINLASHLEQALYLIRKQQPVLNLLSRMNDPHVPDSVIWRVQELASRRNDIRYENPYDIALTIYLFALVHRAPTHAPIAAAVIMQLPKLWWSVKFTERFLEGHLQRNGAADQKDLASQVPSNEVDRLMIVDVRSQGPLHRHSTTISRRRDSGSNTTTATIVGARRVSVENSSTEWQTETAA